MTLNFFPLIEYKIRNTFMESHVEYVHHQKLVPGVFLILVNNLKLPLHARYSFRKKMF